MLDCLGERKFTAVCISIPRRKTVNQEQYFNEIYILFVLFFSTAGSITVKAPSSLQAYLKLSGKEVVVDADAHVHDMAKDHKGGGVTVTGKQTVVTVGGWCVSGSANCSSG